MRWGNSYFRPHEKGQVSYAQSSRTIARTRIQGSAQHSGHPFSALGYEFWLLLLQMTNTKPFYLKPAPVRSVYTETHDTHESQETQTLRDSETHDTQETQDSALLGSLRSVEAAVEISLREGLHENVLFVFARALRSFEINSNRRLTAKEQQAAFGLWWGTARKQELDSEAIRTQYELDFLDTFSKTKIPLGASALCLAIDRADDSALPACAEGYDPATARLIAVCWQLSDCGCHPFYMSVRDAARIMDIKSIVFAGKMLNGLVIKGLFKQNMKHAPAQRKASEFQFVL